MSEILEIQQRIRKLYQVRDEPAGEIPLEVERMLWISFARQYLEAAGLIVERAPQLWLARLQLTGHSAECALKACLVAVTGEAPHKHDLVELADRVSNQGFQLPSLELAAIVHLDHFYNRDLGTGTPFKSRYPSVKNERVGGSVPDHSVFTSLVESLCGQAEAAAKPRREDALDGG